jgi:hypothetical protein
VGGTSDGAPQWAGLFAELNQREGGPGAGNPGARLYGLCGTPTLHDVTSGSNGDYRASTGYDLVTGLGTPEVRNLLAGSNATTTTTVRPASTTTIRTTTTSTTVRTVTTTTFPPGPPSGCALHCADGTSGGWQGSAQQAFAGNSASGAVARVGTVKITLQLCARDGTAEGTLSCGDGTVPCGWGPAPVSGVLNGAFFEVEGGGCTARGNFIGSTLSGSYGCDAVVSGPFGRARGQATGTMTLHSCP